jgi:hypothetical protein
MGGSKTQGIPSDTLREVQLNYYWQIDLRQQSNLKLKEALIA